VGDRFEAEHGPDPALDSTVVLFNPIIEVLALPDADRLQWSSRLVSKPALAIAGNDCFPVRLATVNDDAIWSTMAFQRFADKAFGSRQVTVFA
jgi:hypothetical protein